MPDLPERKVGIIACSGEEMPEGTVARLAALKVLNELRRRETVTLCLPLFLAGGAADRAFARIHPTITVDGCGLRGAARATEQHSHKPFASLVIDELLAQAALPKPAGCRRLDAAGQKAVATVAERLAALVDQALGRKTPLAENALAPVEPDAGPREVTCSCGSGVPVTQLLIAGKPVEVVALPLILRRFREEGRALDQDGERELFDRVRIYNEMPPETEASYREAVLQEYRTFCQNEKSS